MKIKSFKQITCKLVFTGLMLNLMATSLPLHAQQKTEAQLRQRWEEEQRQKAKEFKKTKRLEYVKREIERLKTQLKKMRKARAIVIVLIGGMGATIAVVGAGIFGAAGVAILFSGSVLTIPALIVAGLALTGASFGVHLMGLAGGTAAFMTLFNTVATKKTIKKLEQIETTYPRTLTKKQKLVIKQLKNELKNPITRGIAQAVAEKKALDTIVQSVLDNNPQFKQSLGNKATKRLSKHIRWNWQLANLKNVLSSVKKWHPKYLPLAMKLKIKKSQLKKLHKKYPQLKSQKQPVDDFTNKIKQLRVGLAN